MAKSTALTKAGPLQGQIITPGQVAADEKLAKEMLALIGGNDDEATVKQFLSTGYPELDVSLSSTYDGGFPVGRIVELSGPPSSGKTAISTAVMAAAQRMGGLAGFHDHERSFSFRLGEKLGLNTSARFIYKKPRTFENSLDIALLAAKHIRANNLIPREAPIAYVFDSLASMVPHSALFDAKTGKEKDLDKRSMHDNTALARATSAAMPAFAQWCEELDICAIFLNQIRTKLGVMYGDPRTTPGGDAPKFYASVRIMLGAGLITKGEGAKKEVIGSNVTASIIKNKVGRPHLKSEWRFVFQPDGTGRFDVERSTIDFLDRQGCLEKKGNYIVWEGKNRYAEELARIIESEGPAGMAKLKALLPAAYQPPVIAEIADMATTAADSSIDVELDPLTDAQMAA